ncbi:Hypothetical protein PENO1_104160 [Penicillium occitanis (nom. inval.)]|nr:Hypothetical protein PENO1_104160 [Penicillium occitanis (nom. inval.)]PCG89885.1 hypothetical protein PENOC_104560 [Penicillium occitanis (nom. inval.)]
MTDHYAHRSPADFLFVDYQDDKQQNRSISRQKAVFAQKAHQRKKRLAAVERLKTYTNPFRQQLPVAYKSDSFGTSQEVVKSKHGGSTPEPAGPDGKAHLWSPQSHLGQGFLDPFSTTVLPMNKSTNLFFHHYWHFIRPRAYPLGSSRMGAWWWQQGHSEPVVQLTLLVSAANHKLAMDTINNVPAPHLQRSMREFLRIRGDTIGRLNSLLQDPSGVAESTILVVGALRAIEGISCGFDAIAVHTKGLNALIQLYGGLETMDHQILFQIYHSEMTYAAITNRTPALPLIARWRSEIRQATKFFDSDSDFVLHLDVKPEIAVQLSMLVQYFELANLQPSVVLPTDDSMFLLFGYQLVSIRYTAKPAEDFDSHTVSSLLNEPLRLTLFIYLNMRIWNFQDYPMMHHLVKSLRDTLLFPISTASPALAHIKRTAPGVLFWILFIGGMAAQGHSPHSWFLHQLADLVASLQLREWGVARELLGGFLYTDQPGQLRGEMLWELILLTELEGH